MISNLFAKVCLVSSRIVLSAAVAIGLCVGVGVPSAFAQLAGGQPVGTSEAGIGGGIDVGGAGGTGAGGGSFADFDSLIELIQTTVSPETWDLLGGPSTMADYPAGVLINSRDQLDVRGNGIGGSAAADIRAALNPDAADEDSTDWTEPSRMRCVSLRRLRDTIRSNFAAGVPLDESILHLAGLSRVQFVVLTEDDVILASPIGGIQAVGQFLRDRKTGDGTIGIDALTTGLASSISGVPFGCTIDPTTAGLKAATQVGVAINSKELPIGKAAEQMKKSLGTQNVEVFGIPGNTHLALLMIAADRHMKQLALGTSEMPDGTRNYLDHVDANIAQGVPSDLLLRLWFAPKEVAVRHDSDQKTFELGGRAIRLSGQNERAMKTGERGNLTTDFRSEQFVEEFNRNWISIRTKYPVYGALESIYQAASVAELLRRHADTSVHKELLHSLAVDSSAYFSGLPILRRVDSIAVMHTVRHGRKRHHILMASGGVKVDTRSAVAMKERVYPGLDGLDSIAAKSPSDSSRWWWNVAATTK